MLKNQTLTKINFLLKQENTFLKLEVKRQSEIALKRLFKANRYEEEIAGLENQISNLKNILHDYYDDPKLWIAIQNHCKEIEIKTDEERLANHDR